MLRRVRNRSMSSLVLDTQSCAASGPVISVSCSNGAVTSEIPSPRLAASEVDDADACPAWEAPRAEYFRTPAAAGLAAASAPAMPWLTAPSVLEKSRYSLVHWVRPSGHSCS